MRVLMLHNDYARVGGEYFSVRAEAEGLRKLGVEVELLVVDNSELVGNSALRNARELFRNTRSRAEIEGALRHFNPDLVHAQNLFPLLGGGVIEVLAQWNVPWVRTLRNYRLRCLAGTCFRDNARCTDCRSAAAGFPGVWHSCYRQNAMASAGALLYARKEAAARAAHPPRAHILLSEAMRPMFSELLTGIPTFVKANPVDSRSESPLPRNRRNGSFLYVGRIDAGKGLEPLLQEFDAQPSAQLVVVGSGDLAPELSQKMRGASNISFLGERPADEVSELMRNSLAVLVPSLWDEPFGRVAAEALAAGTPAIVANSGGLPEIVRPLGFAPLVVNHGERFMPSISAILGLNAPEYDALAHAARERWATAFEPGLLSQELEEIYRAVLAA